MSIPTLPGRLGWQPSRFLTDRGEAERAFQLAEQLGSVNAAAKELGTTWPSLRPVAHIGDVDAAAAAVAGVYDAAVLDLDPGRKPVGEPEAVVCLYPSRSPSTSGGGGS
jgi:hypothetical protein